MGQDVLWLIGSMRYIRDTIISYLTRIKKVQQEAARLQRVLMESAERIFFVGGKFTLSSYDQYFLF